MVGVTNMIRFFLWVTFDSLRNKRPNFRANHPEPEPCPFCRCTPLSNLSAEHHRLTVPHIAGRHHLAHAAAGSGNWPVTGRPPWPL